MGQADTQAEELEALEAIYPGEIEVENREYPNIVFRISLHLHSELEPGRADEAASAQAFQVTLLLRLPRDYPDVVPDIELLGLDGIFNERRVQRVIDELRAVAEGNLGMPMGFTIVSALQDHMGSLIEEENAEKAKAEEMKRKEEEAIARKKLEGTRVTVESFLAWRQKWDAEMKLLKEKDIMAREAALAGRLTGRQLFLRDTTLSLSDVALIQGDAIEIDETLFDEELEGLEIEDSDEEV
uniref:RWD domain-containing protein n=2 Tax=Ascaris TaxID=6251 RepID=A0A9J2P7N6_ASCLU